MSNTERLSVYSLDGKELDTLTIMKNIYNFTDVGPVRRLINSYDWAIDPHKAVFEDGSTVLL